MSLSPGTKLGPYEIVAPLGAGGMGEVYRAHDSRLNRDVAIKALPAAFADNADRMARFQREAQVLAALNHPHIAAVYGIEESAIVMELVEGKNLAGPVPVGEAVAIARQLADALDAAHQKNIIHRDLKPGNIKVTPEGSVKVLDFGLAKAFEGSPVTSNPENSPTITMESTQAGVILGTAGYMSPEQARGKAVDKRTDIWSFGAVFYELLTGRRAFKGETVSDTLASVLKSDPDWTRLPAGTSVGVRRLLERCLERDPNKRLRDIGDAWLELDRTADAPRRTELHWIPWAIAALAVAGAAAWEMLHVPVTPPRAVTRSAMTLAAAYAIYPALSRDGTRLVYAQGSSASLQLWLRMMDQLEGKPIPGGENATLPEFSPDGQWIAYYSWPNYDKLKKIPVNGGTPIALCELPPPPGAGAAWGVDDAIVFGTSKGLMRVAAAGGTPQALTFTKNGERSHSFPQILPGGRAIVFTVNTRANDPDSAHIAVLDLKTGTTRVLVNSGREGRLVPSGHLVYGRKGTLFAAPFDLKRLEVTGPETPVAEGISWYGYTFSDSSLLVFNASNAGEMPPSKLEWADRKGVTQPLSDPPHRWGAIAVSPDGKLVAGEIRGGTPTSGRAPSDIWIYDLERRTLARLTFEGFNYDPVWTPDGQWVTYKSIRDGKHGIYRVAADRSGQPELLVAADLVVPSSWTPDGKTLLGTQGPDEKSQIWILPAPGGGGDSKPRLFFGTSFNEDNPRVSPDGKWMAYQSDESGKYEIYVVPFPGPGGKVQISTQGGQQPVWSRSGRELFYGEPDSNQLMVIDVTAGPVIRAGRPQALLNLTGSGPDYWVFDVTPDPKRFLVARAPTVVPGMTFVTITNWFDDLRRRAPLKK
jgi:eukaryotic-like serine/threonine-protein kinase